MGKKYPFLLKEYERILKERVDRGELEEKVAEVYFDAASRILEAAVNEMLIDQIASIVKKTDPCMTKGYLNIVKRAARDLKAIASTRDRK